MKNLSLEKAKAALLYITNEFGKVDLLRAFKILYFAEQAHLVKYGETIIEDRYVAMERGPVPSYLFDLFKDLRNGVSENEENLVFSRTFRMIGNHFFTGLEKPNLDFLSKSNLECLDTSIRENGHLSFNELSRKSHDEAWNSTGANNTMDICDIARAGGAEDEFLEYIRESQELKYFNLV